MATVSIIMGIFNCAETLNEAIDSILAQTYEDWEMIMCDDGSSDETYIIAETYVTTYPQRFVLLRNQRNMGLNYTLNRCLSVAKGKYIARMDGDDISLPTRIEKEVDFLEQHPQYAIVSTLMDYFNEDGVFMSGKESGEPLYEDVARRSPFSHPACMVRSDAYAAVNGYSVDSKLMRLEDWHLWIKMYAAGYRGYIFPEVLYQIRDDWKAYKRRKFRYRIYESRLIFVAVNVLHLKKWRYIYALRPLLVGLLPAPVYLHLHRHRFANQTK